MAITLNEFGIFLLVAGVAIVLVSGLIFLLSGRGRRDSDKEPLKRAARKSTNTDVPESDATAGKAHDPPAHG